MSAEPDRHLDEDLCLDLIFGQLSAQETQRWSDHLLRCAVCEDLVRARSAQLETRRAGPLPRRERDGRFDLYPRSGPIRPSRKRRIRWVASPALIAAAAVVLLLLWQGRQPDQDPPPVFWIERDLEEVVPRSSGASTEALQDGLRAYADHDAQRAAGLLEEAQVSEGLDGIRRLYLASAQLHLGHTVESIRLLRSLEPMTLPSPWRDDALWTLHAALVRGGRPAAADSLLTEMARLPGETGQRARRLRQR